MCVAVSGCSHMCLFIAGANSRGLSMSHARTTQVCDITTTLKIEPHKHHPKPAKPFPTATVYIEVNGYLLLKLLNQSINQQEFV